LQVVSLASTVDSPFLFKQRSNTAPPTTLDDFEMLAEEYMERAVDAIDVVQAKLEALIVQFLQEECLMCKGESDPSRPALYRSGAISSWPWTDCVAS
jgi:hypothetical protein